MDNRGTAGMFHREGRRCTSLNCTERQELLESFGKRNPRVKGDWDGQAEHDYDG